LVVIGLRSELVIYCCTLTTSKEDKSKIYSQYVYNMIYCDLKIYLINRWT